MNTFKKSGNFLQMPHFLCLESKAFGVMGIINVTPDSFSDGGRFYLNNRLNLEKILFEAEQMVRDGAFILDIGGESSGPDSKDVSLEEELRRVIPVVKMFRKRWPRRKYEGRGRLWSKKQLDQKPEEVLPILSVDTYKTEVARQAIFAGADMVNDVTALRGGGENGRENSGSRDGNEGGCGHGPAGMAQLVAETGVPIVLMYSKNSTVRTTRESVQYNNVVKTIKDFFSERISFAEENGIRRDQIILDPGMGFFVSGDPKYSFEILERLDEFLEFGCPILVAPSRKSFLGGSVKDRLPGTVAACQKAVLKGARILRVHDVAAVLSAISRAILPASSCRPRIPASQSSRPEARTVE